MKNLCFLIVCLTTILFSCKKEENNKPVSTITTSGTPPTNTITISDLWTLGNGTNIGWIEQEKDKNGNWIDYINQNCNCMPAIDYYPDYKKCVNPTFLDTNLAIHKNVRFGFFTDGNNNNNNVTRYWKYSNDTLFQFNGTVINGGCLSSYGLTTYKIVSLTKFIMELRNINDPNNRIYRYRKE